MTLYALFEGSCPGGWVKKTVDDERFTYITDTDVDTTDGSTTATHSHTPSSDTRTSNAHCGSCFYHSFHYYNQTAVDIRPDGIKYLMCQPPAIIVNMFPSGAILLDDSGSCPTGWSEYSSGNSKYVRFTETVGDAGDSVSGNLGSHTHTISCAESRNSSGRDAGCDAPTTSSNVLSTYTDLYHIKLMLCKRD